MHSSCRIVSLQTQMQQHFGSLNGHSCMSTSHSYLQNTIFNLSPWLNFLIDVIGEKNAKPTGCRVFWRAFFFTLRFMVQFLLRESPMQHCWINIYFRKTLWRRSDLVGSFPHPGHTNMTQHFGIFEETDFFFFFKSCLWLLCTGDFLFTSACLAHQIITICISKDFPTNACHADTQLHFLWML